MPPKKKTKMAGGGADVKASSKLYTLVVYLIGGPIGGEFEGQTISRAIQVRGDQTLETLHKSIFRAFNRSDPHLYEFLLGTGPDDRSATYSLPMDVAIPGLEEFEEEMAGDLRITTIDSLGLEVGRVFGYRFDFGDNWTHQINVTAIGEIFGKGRYPKVVERVGKSPPQYPDPDED